MPRLDYHGEGGRNYGGNLKKIHFYDNGVVKYNINDKYNGFVKKKQ